MFLLINRILSALTDKKMMI